MNKHKSTQELRKHPSISCEIPFGHLYRHYGRQTHTHAYVPGTILFVYIEMSEKCEKKDAHTQKHTKHMLCLDVYPNLKVANLMLGSLSKQTHPERHISKDLIDTAQRPPK